MFKLRPTVYYMALSVQIRDYFRMKHKPVRLFRRIYFLPARPFRRVFFCWKSSTERLLLPKHKIKTRISVEKADSEFPNLLGRSS